jgi:hypothetical protein
MFDKWLCSCKFTLGIIENKAVLRIKRKDLYVSVEGGNVTEVCPRCGKINTMMDEKTNTGQPVTTPQASV